MSRTNPLLRSLLAVLVITLTSQSSARGQGPVLTAAAIVQAARSLIGDLRNLAADVTGDVAITTNNAATQLSIETDHLEQVLQNQLNVPIVSLSSDLRNEALILNNTVSQASTLLNRQRDCLFAQLDVFTAGLTTAVQRLKAGFPLVSPGNPTVTSFLFDGHLTPNVVPREGGAALVRGFRLWTSAGQPRIELTDEHGTTVYASLQPSRGNSDDSYRIVVPAALLRQHAGECLVIRTTPRQRKKFLAIPVGSRDGQPLNLPLCVPPHMTTQLRLLAHVNYEVPQDQRYALDPWQNFRFDNPDCGHRHSVNMTKGWNLPEGLRIVDIESRRVEQRNDDNNIAFHFNNNTITASGTQAEPTCASFHPPIGPSIERLIHTAIWSYDARPVVAGTIYTPRTDSATTTLIAMIIPATQLCAAVQKLANVPGRQSTVWYTVTVVINGRDGPSYTSPHYSTVNTMPLPNETFAGSYNVGGQFNPTPVDGNCQVCTTVTSTRQCGF
jgi:hypothetical protein